MRTNYGAIGHDWNGATSAGQAQQPSKTAPSKGRARKGGACLADEILQTTANFDLTQLKTRTLEVALCALEGDAVADIARFIDASPSTVRRHLSQFAALVSMDGGRLQSA